VSKAGSAVAPTEPLTSYVEPNARPEVDQLTAAVSQALEIGGNTSTTTFTGATPKSMPVEGGQSEGLLAIDTALESWGQPTGYDLNVWVPINDTATPSNDEEADRLWGDGELDWFLTGSVDVVSGRLPDEIIPLLS
jgi:hypothetical protein